MLEFAGWNDAKMSLSQLIKIRKVRLTDASVWVVVLLCVVAALLIVRGYHRYSQAYDEPAHVLCGMEWLDKGSYTLEPLHPPLARVAVALGPFLSGLRLPDVPVVHDSEGKSYDLFAGGDKILYARQHEFTLILARLGELPFFALGVFLVFTWTRSLFGDAAALFGAFLFVTIPSVLAFAGIAYTDLPVTAMIAAALFAFSNWLQDCSTERSIWLGLAIGAAVLSKFTALLFLPVCFISIFVAKTVVEREETNVRVTRHSFTAAGIVTIVTAFVIWGGYRFSLERLDQAYANPRQDIARIRLFPSGLQRFANRIVDVNPPLPAVPLLKGVAADWQMNQKSNPSYLLGHIRRGGWWYFFLVGLGVKTPLPCLFLAMIGAVVGCAIAYHAGEWRPLVPAVSVIGMLVVTMPTKIDLGTRHLLPVYPLLAVLGGAGADWLRKIRPLHRRPILLTSLLACQLFSTVQAHSDYFSYFNVLAGTHPENVLLWGCDFDCGQDLVQLSQALQEDKVDHVTLKLWTSAALSQSGLPPFDVLRPYERRSGWIAASVRMVKTGDAFPNGGPADAYFWLKSYKPVSLVGKTIQLYYISPAEQ